MANCANVTTATTAAVTFAHHRNLPVLPDAQGNGGQAANVTTEMVYQYGIPPNDASNLLSGKMIIEALDSIICYADTPNALKLTLSILETANA
jgi:hypothetical protein